MKLNGKFKFLGIESNPSRDGSKIYTKLGLLQGLNSEIIYPNEEIIRMCKDIPTMSDVDCLLDIVFKPDKTTYVNIVEIKQSIPFTGK